jgi:hypothetical protein
MLSTFKNVVHRINGKLIDAIDSLHEGRGALLMRSVLVFVIMCSRVSHFIKLVTISWFPESGSEH